MAGRTVMPADLRLFSEFRRPFARGASVLARRAAYSSRGEVAVSRAIRSAPPVTHSAATT